MILLVEEDKSVSKKLCDILTQERIITVGSKQQILEALVHHRKKLKVVIANARAVRAITSGDIITKLCKKIMIEIPPILGFYRKGEEQLVKKIIEGRNDQKFVKYDEKDMDFPSKYVKAIKTLYSDLRVDINRVTVGWTKSEEKQDLDDVRNWLKKEGFAEKPQQSVKEKKEKSAVTSRESKKPVDYKKLYLEVKRKYDELLKYIQELTDTV